MTGTHPGELFRADRLRAGVSLRAAARHAGISAPTVSRWERGQRDISLAAAARLRDALSPAPAPSSLDS